MAYPSVAQSMNAVNRSAWTPRKTAVTKKTQRVVEFVLRSSWFLCWGVVGLFTTSLGFTGCTYSPTYSSALQSRGGVGSTFEKPSAKRHAAGAATANKRTETTLSVDEAIVVATRDNRALADLRARAPMQQAEIELADQWEDPELRISEISIDDMLDGEPTLELALRIPFQRPGSLSVKRTLSALSYAHLNARIRSAEHKLAVDIRRLYFHLAMVELDLQEVAQEITAREKHVDLVRRRVRAGVSVELDLSMASLPHAQALDEHARIISKQRALEAQLSKMLGQRRNYTPRLVPISLTPAQTALAPVDSYIKRAISTRPELHRAMLRKEHASALTYLAKQRQWPWPDFAQVSYEIRHPLQPTRFGLALALKIPVFEWAGNRVEVHDAELKLRETEEESLLHAIEHDVRTAYDKVQRLSKRLAALQKTLLPASVTSAMAAERATSESTMDPLKASVIEGRRIRAKRYYLRILAEYHEARFALEQLAGPGT